MMTVTQFSKSIGQPSWALWDSEFPDQTIRFRERGRFFGDSIESGERFHRAFSRFTEGLRVSPVHHAVCLATRGLLADEEVVKFKSEVPVRGFGLSGQVDIVGKLDSGRPVLVELKTTLGEFALKPRPAEVIQLGTYAAMLELKNPLLIWLRVSLKSRCISAFKMEESEPLLGGIIGHVPSQQRKAA